MEFTFIFNKNNYAFSVQKLITPNAIRRSISDAVKYPKITTHYTVCPREKDERWKGKLTFEQYDVS